MAIRNTVEIKENLLISDTMQRTEEIRIKREGLPEIKNKEEML